MSDIRNVAYKLAGETGCAPQTAKRWLSGLHVNHLVSNALSSGLDRLVSVEERGGYPEKVAELVALDPRKKASA